MDPIPPRPPSPPPRPQSAPPDAPPFPKPSPPGPNRPGLVPQGSPGFWTPPPPPRPDSPTYKNLRERADRERFGELAVPIDPGHVRPADVHEQAALNMFKDNMDQADPTGLLRALGEFFQTFSAKPERMDFIANHPIHYQKGGQVNAPPPEAFPPGTTHIVHSHPPAPPGSTSAFPSAQDYLGTYLINEGGKRDMEGILHHPSDGRSFAFKGGVDRETGAPTFDRLTRSGLQQLREWQEKYGNASVTPPPGEPPSGSPPAP